MLLVFGWSILLRLTLRVLPPCLQEVGWFDREENSSGVLTSKLSSDAVSVKGMSGDTLGLLTQVSVDLNVERPTRCFKCLLIMELSFLERRRCA